MPECVGLGVDHDGAAAGEDEGECADRLSRKRARERPHAVCASAAGSTSACSRCIASGRIRKYAKVARFSR